MENIRIAVLSTYDEVCAFLDNSIAKAMHYWNDELHTYLKGGAYTYSFKTFTDYEDAQYLTVGNKISFIYKDKGYYLNIVDVDRDQVYTTVTAYGLSLELTNEETGPYKATGAMSFEQYINAFNFEKPFVVGVNEVSDKRITHEWEGTDTILARLFSLANVFSAELEFVTELDNDYSLKRIVMNVYREHDDNYQGIGSDKRNDGTIKYGKEIKGISKKSDITELYTAIRPTGNDGLTLSSIDKKEYDANGNLEYSSPKGTIEILAPQARDRFPSTLMADVNGRYICKQWSYDTSNVNTLYGQALAQLKKNCTPQVSYTVDGYIDANIGDTFVIEDSEYKPTLYLEARVTEQQISFINKDNCKTTFDNFEDLQSQINESLIDEMKSLINANKMYDASIITSNGSVFKNDTDSTVLTALIRENGVDITETLTVFWYKDGNKILEQKSVSVTATDFIEKAVYKFEAFKDEQMKATCEITVINVRDGKDGSKGDKGDKGNDGKNNIIVSTTPPESPTTGQLWQTASGETIKSWNGQEWIIHYLSVENLDVDKLSAISANLGDITGGSLNINDKFVVNNEGVLEATSGTIGGWNIDDDYLKASGGGTSYPRTMQLISDGTLESQGIDKNSKQINRSVIYSGSMRVETLDGTDVTNAKMKYGVDISGLGINLFDSVSESCGYIGINLAEHAITIENPIIHGRGSSGDSTATFSNGIFTFKKNNGNSSVQLKNEGGIELFHDSTPYVDFHYGNSSSDYTSRILGNSNGTMTAYSSISNSSDKRLKEDIEDLPDSFINILNNLKPKKYKFIKNPQDEFMGFIAQDVLKLIKEENNNTMSIVTECEDGYYALDYSQIIPLLVLGYQKQQKEILKLKELISKGES